MIYIHPNLIFNCPSLSTREVPGGSEVCFIHGSIPIPKPVTGIHHNDQIIITEQMNVYFVVSKVRPREAKWLFPKLQSDSHISWDPNPGQHLSHCTKWFSGGELVLYCRAGSTKGLLGWFGALLMHVAAFIFIPSHVIKSQGPLCLLITLPLRSARSSKHLAGGPWLAVGKNYFL